MTITTRASARKRTTKKTSNAGAHEVPLFDAAIATTRSGPHATNGRALEADVIDAVQSRQVRELADLKILRSIFKLNDQGVPQRRIADLVGLSQPEVSRRLKRRSLTPVDVSPREIALQRAAGLLSSAEMMRELSDFTYTSESPSRESAFDGAASSGGSSRQLTASFQEGLLSQEEYDALCGSIRTVRKARKA
jgi:predicted transcriptional regulator